MMKHLARYIEEIHLGVIHNPHTDHHERLTEKVTVCPSCNSLRSLRREGSMVHCLECSWDISIPDTQKPDAKKVA